MKSRLKVRAPDQGTRITTKEELSISPQQMRPKFGLEHIHRSHCLSSCTTDERAAFADRLHLLSGLTWQQITQAHRHGHGPEIIARNAIKAGIPACITEDTNIIAFRFFGKAPMVGFREAEVFFVVWIDRDFTLYDHG